MDSVHSPHSVQYEDIAKQDQLSYNQFSLSIHSHGRKVNGGAPLNVLFHRAQLAHSHSSSGHRLPKLSCGNNAISSDHYLFMKFSVKMDFRCVYLGLVVRAQLHRSALFGGTSYGRMSIVREMKKCVYKISSAVHSIDP